MEEPSQLRPEKLQKQADGAAVLRMGNTVLSPQLFVQQRMQFRVQILCLCK